MMKWKLFFKATPLHYAVFFCRTEIVKLLLLNKDIDVNIKNKVSFTLNQVWPGISRFFFILWKTPIDLTRNEAIKNLIIEHHQS